ncbi:hypothetical protein HYPSUDRAFT_349009 [Hypholoma sublateritium FD-334 SS-4]|uniref:Uncharacterized protein n=1 Tax=Hypholoma sublateritium (strain FD-334 SS-4) TaxID=945553 RepID=A0A0D2MQ40_HYPSF|nr:hypothetical protein HYPSUDRAFT_349009 [Hypholoma sublateritium FD-334 SS-4]
MLTSAANLCTALILCTIFGLTSAAPVQLENALRARDLQPITPTSQIQPGMFDLLDQYRNLAQQAAAAPKGTPQYTALVTKMNSTKTQLETAIQGVAVLAADPSTTSTNAASSTIAPTTTASAAPSTTPTPSAAITTTASPGSKSESAGTSSSLTTTSPTAANVPAMTIVTQVGTSIVVVASQGVTSTITLATRTTVSGAAISTSSSSSGATSTFDINTAAAPGTTKAAQSNIDSSSVSLLIPSLWSGSMLAAGLTVGTLMAL